MVPILQRKESQEVLRGDRFVWDYNKRCEIIKLNKIQSDMVDSCLVRNDWTKWFQIENRIKEIQCELDSNINFELMIVDLYLKTGA